MPLGGVTDGYFFEVVMRKYYFFAFICFFFILAFPVKVHAEEETPSGHGSRIISLITEGVTDFTEYWKEIWSSGKDVESEYTGSTDPWVILRGSASVNYIGGQNFAISIANILKRMLILLSSIGCLISLITIPFLSRSEAIQQKKQEVMRKLLLLAGTFAVIPTLNFIKWLLDTGFGL